MIKNINSSGRYLTVTGGQTSGPYISPGASGAGMMRWSSNSGAIEVNDGNSWVTVTPGYATVELNPDTESLLEWARKKRSEEMRIKTLAEQHPGIKDLQEKLDIMLALVKEQDTA
jgi:hypothetical protein